MWLRIRCLPWLFGLAVAACRLRYEVLALDSTNLGGDAASGGEAAVIGGSAAQSGSGSAQGGTTTSSGGTDDNAGQSTGGFAEAGNAATGGSTGCADAVLLTANAAPSAAPPISCAYPGALVCDDFEGGQEPYWKVIVNAPAQASLETCLVHGGSHALWALPSGTDNVQVQEQLSPTIAAGSLFMRTFAYLPSSTTLPAWTVLAEVRDSPTSWTNKLSLDLQADSSIVINNWAGAGQQKTSLTSPAALLPRDRWTCIELEIVVDKTNGATRLYLDDMQVITSVGNIRTVGTKALTTVSLGAVIADGSAELYHDDFVVATQRIGCN